jgi:hypothetical protein
LCNILGTDFLIRPGREQDGLGNPSFEHAVNRFFCRP